MFRPFLFRLLVLISILPLNDLAAQSLNTKALTQKAILLSVKGKLNEALKIFKAIVEKEPNNYFALNNLGKAYIDVNQFDQAITTFKKALVINPSFWMAENNLADAYKRNGNYEQAEKLLKKVLNNFSNLELANANLGEIYLSQKRYDEAIIYLKKAVAVIPTAAQYHLLLGKALQAKNMNKEAEREFDLYNRFRKNK